jgi:hypothetical protein
MNRRVNGSFLNRIRQLQRKNFSSEKTTEEKAEVVSFKKLIDILFKRKPVL